MIYEAANLLSDYGGELQEDYSGRGMYGKQTCGIVYDSQQEFYKALAMAFEDCLADNNLNDGQLLIDALKALKTDNMGMGIIFY